MEISKFSEDYEIHVLYILLFMLYSVPTSAFNVIKKGDLLYICVGFVGSDSDTKNSDQSDLDFKH